MIFWAFLCLFIAALSAPLSLFAAESGITLAKLGRDADTRPQLPVAPPVVKETYEYYEVRGESEKDLRCTMTEKACRWEDGKKYDSLTKWNVKWDYDYARTPDSCAADSFKATVEVTFHYPKWAHAGDALPPLSEKWERYLRNLALHEQGHRDRAVDTVTALTLAVAALPPASTCAEIDRSVKALCREYMKKLNESQKTYDANTAHGARQGAVFP